LIGPRLVWRPQGGCVVNRFMNGVNRRNGVAASYALLLMLLLLGLSGCGGGTTTTSRNSDPTLTSIAVTPTDALIVVGDTQQFTAIGTYSDASTKDITKVYQLDIIGCY